jgi:hypothetical protein
MGRAVLGCLSCGHNWIEPHESQEDNDSDDAGGDDDGDGDGD